jgi:hypothetical protein
VSSDPVRDRLGTRGIASGWLAAIGGATFLVGLLLPWLQATGSAATRTALQLGPGNTLDQNGLAGLALGLVLLATALYLVVERRGRIETIVAPTVVVALSLLMGLLVLLEWRYLTAHLHAAGAGATYEFASGIWVCVVGGVVALGAGVLGLAASESVGKAALLRWVREPGAAPSPADASAG